jgi:hypothetical protein
VFKGWCSAGMALMALTTGPVRVSRSRPGAHPLDAPTRDALSSPHGSLQRIPVVHSSRPSSSVSTWTQDSRARLVGNTCPQ